MQITVMCGHATNNIEVLNISSYLNRIQYLLFYFIFFEKHQFHYLVIFIFLRYSAVNGAHRKVIDRTFFLVLSLVVASVL